MLKIFNTLSKTLEEFQPIEKRKVRFYQCGPTVYSRQHIGNLFSAVKGDFIRRALLYLGYDVNYTKNITDVGHLVSDEDEGEDKMAKGVKKEGLSPKQIAEKYTDLYRKDLAKLNVLEPDHETIATEYVDQMADLVQDLIDNGYAYATDKAIYFDVDKFPSYTDLSGQKLEKNIKGAGHGSEGDEDKKNSYDFAIWFFKTGVHANAIQTWEKKFKGIEQPILSGFPGWHIECSAMSKATLGDTLDIHMGGIEHIPVHHTNEIAQSECATGQKYVNYWMHHEWLLFDGGKMSKSLGNIYTLEQLEEKGYSPLVYRYFLLQAHYRSKQNFTWEAMDGAKNAYEKLVNRVLDLDKKVDFRASSIDKEVKENFIEALEDDFNFPEALSVMWNMLKSDISDEAKYSTLLDFDRVLGLCLDQVKEEEIPEEAKKLIEERKEARENKDWEKADALRDRLKEEFGVEVKDR